MTAFRQQNCEQVGANLSLLDLLKFLCLDLFEELEDSAVVFAEDAVLPSHVVWEEFGEEQVHCL